MFASSKDGVQVCFPAAVLDQDGPVGVERDGTGSGVAMSLLLLLGLDA